MNITIPWSRRVATTIIPPLLLGSFGLFSWAIRGQSGYGATAGSMFAAFLWGLGWYWLSKEDGEHKQRRYSLGWSVLAITIGTGFGGMHGWAQWPRWVEGLFFIDWPAGEFVPISPAIGYTWVFISGTTWAGMGAVLLAWTGSKKPLVPKEWLVRIAFGAGGASIAFLLFSAFPSWFLPFHGTAVDYADPACIQCPRVFGDNRFATIWLGLYLGCLCHEIYRKDWVNVKLITIVGVLSGFSWVIFQFWHFMHLWFPDVPFNWWRGWEASGGFGFGIAYGIAFVVCNKPRPADHPHQRIQPFTTVRNAEHLVGVRLTIAAALAYSMSSGIKGYTNLYHGLDETVLGWFLPLVVLFAGWWLASVHHVATDPFTRGDGRDNVPRFTSLFLVVYAVHRTLGLLVTGPLDIWSEVVYFVLYLVIVVVDVLLATWWRASTRDAPQLDGRST